MADFPGLPLVPLADDRSGNCISTFSGWALGPCHGLTPVAVAWPAANRAIFTPFRVPVPVTVYKLACATNTGTTGNFDLGIYDQAGNLIVSTGSTAKTTASSERVVDITDTLLLPGMYYLAMVTDGTTNYVGYTTGIPNLGIVKQFGVRQMNSAFALPSTATFATVASAVIPTVAAYLRSE